MSRVDDARRRAAVLTVDSLAIVPMPGLPVGPDLDAIEINFPDERPVRQQTWARTVQTTLVPPTPYGPPTSPATVDAAPAVPPPTFPTAVDAAPAAPRPIFPTAVDTAPAAPRPMFPTAVDTASAAPRPIFPTAVDTSPAAPATSPATVDAAPTVSLLEGMDTSLREKVVIDERTPSIPREQYRRIAAVLHEAQHAKGLRVVMVASAVGGEGKTLTAINLALTLSESYRKRVLLVDGDFRAPALHRAFPLTSMTPVAETSNASGMELGLGDVSPTLALLSSRASTSDPMADLTSERMKEVIADARRTFDWVVVDAPPVVALPDAPLLGSMVDGVVLVIRAGSTAHALVARAIDSLGRSRILGVVLNDARVDVRELDDKRYRFSAGVLS